MAKRKSLAETLAGLSFVDDQGKSRFPLMETHCHLDYLKQGDLQQTLTQSLAVGINKIMTISVSPDNLNEVLNISRPFEYLYCSQGIHPHSAQSFTAEVKKKLVNNFTDESVKAVGEIGLDYHYNHSPKKEQIKAFEEQLQMACDHQLPVIIHTREADEDTLSILKNIFPHLTAGGVIHSYTSGKALAEFALANNFYIGFNGIITFKNAQDVRDILKMTPLKQILLETDAPFLTPTPHRGIENAPFYLPFIAQKVLEIKQVTAEAALPIFYQNSLDLFHL